MSLASLMPMSPSAEQRVFGDPLIAASSPIAAGAVAPAFALAGAADRKIALSDFVGQTVILVFYPADWSPVCTDQLALYNELLPLFGEHRAQVLGIIHCLRRCAAQPETPLSREQYRTQPITHVCRSRGCDSHEQLRPGWVMRLSRHAAFRAT